MFASPVACLLTPSAVQGNHPSPGLIMLPDEVIVGPGQLVAEAFPLANDFSLDGSPASLVALLEAAPAAAGLLQIDGNRVVYRRAPGYGGSIFSVGYSAQTASGGSGSSEISFVVAAPTGPVLLFPKDPPASVGTPVSATTTTFASVYGSATAGQHIVLDNGDYGTLDLNRNFSASQPVVIRAANPGVARITGKVNVTGTGHWLYQLDLAETPTGLSGLNRANRLAKMQVQVTTAGDRHLYITRCFLRSEIAVRIGPRVHYVWLGWNKFDGKLSQPYGAHVDIEQGLFTDAADALHDILVYRNDFTDDGTRQVDGAGAPYENHHVLVYQDYLSGLTGLRQLRNVVIAENRFKNSHRRYWALGHLGCTIRDNDVDHIDASLGGFRYGAGGVLWGNRLGSGDNVIVAEGNSGLAHDLRGNLVGGEIRLYAGSIDAASNRFPAADYALLVRNQASRIVVGQVDAGFSIDTIMGGTVDHVRAYANSVAATRSQVDASTFDEDLDDGHGLPAPLPTAVLGDTEVGPGLSVTPPSITAGADVAMMTTGAAGVSLDVLANDSATPTGTTLKITGSDVRLVSGTGGSGACTIAVINGGVPGANNVRITRNTQGAGTFTFEYRPRFSDDSYVSPTWVRITLTINAVSAEARLYQPPHRPVTESEIVTWDVATQANPPAGDWTKYLQVIQPNTAYDGFIARNNMRYKGIISVGGLRYPRGATLAVPPGVEQIAANAIPGSATDVFRFIFAGDQPAGGPRPYAWCDGMRGDTCPTGTPGVDNRSFWGDWFGFGTAVAPGTAYDKQCDIFLLRNVIENGYYFFTGTLASEINDPTKRGKYLNPHSDVMQNEGGGYRALMVWKMRARWHDQGFFLVANGNNTCHLEGYAEFSQVHFSKQADTTKTPFNFATGNFRPIKTDDNTINCSLSTINTTDYKGDPTTIPPGRYYALFLGPGIYFDRNGITGSNNGKVQGFGKSGTSNCTLTWNTATNNKVFISRDARCFNQTPKLHPYPYTGGTEAESLWHDTAVRPAIAMQDYFEATPPASPVVTADEAGLGRLITTKAALLEYLNGSM